MSIFRAVAVLLGLAGSFCIVIPPVHAAGAISVVDGDTLQIGDKVVNLYGIDAPELGQLCFHDGGWNKCGQAAAFELKKLIEFDAPPECTPAPQNQNQVVCRASGRDVALVLLHAGYVVAATESGEIYRLAEKSAKEGKLGLWHMALVSPWDWRHGRRVSEGEAAAERSCPIKAVIAADGARLYYVPTDRVYRTIKVDTDKGDRRFCSDAEAREAGWRRPGESK
jgi:endonuclease YncB( thermonuclease family)